MPEPRKQFIIFSKIQLRDEALAIVNIMSGFMVVWLFASVVFLMWRFKSRVASILLFILLVYSLVFALTAFPKSAFITVGILGPIIWISVRTIEATFKLHGRLAK